MLPQVTGKRSGIGFSFYFDTGIFGRRGYLVSILSHKVGVTIVYTGVVMNNAEFDQVPVASDFVSNGKL